MTIKNTTASFILLTMLLSLTSKAEFVHIVNHPEARAWYINEGRDTPSKGRQIRELKAYKNRIYMGFGADDERPVGFSYRPLTIRYIDENDKLSDPVGTLQSQEMSHMVEFEGLLYIPAEDFEGDDFTVCDTSGCVGELFSIDSEMSMSHHIYSSAVFNDTLYFVGSNGGFKIPQNAQGISNCVGTIWKKRKGVPSWSIEYRHFKTNTFRGCARIDFIGVANNRLYAQAYQYDSLPPSCPPEVGFCNRQTQDGFLTLKNGAWTTVNEDFEFGSKSIEFANKVIFTRYSTDRLVTFDGETLGFVDNSHQTGGPLPSRNAWGLINEVEDFTVADGFLYLLNRNGNVFRTKDLNSFRFVDRAPSNSVSIEVTNNSVYVGTMEGQVFKSILPIPPKFIRYKNYLIPIPQTGE